MKALVIHNCATSAYTKGLKAIFSDWDVRGVFEFLALQWLEERGHNSPFFEFLTNCDMYIGPPVANRRYEEFLPREVRHVEIPSFQFLGLQPDSFHLPGFVSVFGPGGNLYSKILVAAFSAGVPRSKAEAFFCERVYDFLDYFGEFDRATNALVQRFKSVGIDLSNAVERWLSRGIFLYSYNHPRVDVLIEILRRALVANGFLPISERDRDEDLGVSDDLAESNIWPIYPEIAARHGVNGSLQWRKGRSDGYRTLSLSDFVTATFEALSEKPLPHLKEMPDWKAVIEPSLIPSTVI